MLFAGSRSDRRSLCRVPAADAAALVFSIPPGRVTLLGKATQHELRDVLDRHEGEDVKPVLCIALGGHGGGQALIEDAVAALAAAALRTWPSWYGTEEFSCLDPSTLSRTALRIKLADLQGRLQDLWIDWAVAGARSALSGAPPRLTDSDPAREVVQLSLALGKPILAIDLVLNERPDTYVAPIEWLARTASVPVLVLCREPPSPTPPFDRWPRHVLASSAVEAPRSEVGAVGSVPWLSPIVGRPHPLSEAEKKLASWLSSDIELGPLFAFNRTVRSLQGRCHKVDLLWENGRVVVEIDGYSDHGTRPKFRSDRHRDYELLIAGYRVLRITNEEIEDDCGRVVEKIRDVVRARG